MGSELFPVDNDNIDQNEEEEDTLEKRQREFLTTFFEGVPNVTLPYPLNRIDNSERTMTRYYLSKYGTKEEELLNKYERILFSDNRLGTEYFVGLQWVLRYYYSGVPSWSWFYPYHYAPFARDLAKAPEGKDPEMNDPFTPMQQLMAVLPPDSQTLVPIPFRKLMTDSESPLIEMYPQNFESDRNGFRQEWKAVALLPFIDAQKLTGVLEEVEKTLTPEETRRNRRDFPLMFVHASHPLAKKTFSDTEWKHVQRNKPKKEKKDKKSKKKNKKNKEKKRKEIYCQGYLKASAPLDLSGPYRAPVEGFPAIPKSHVVCLHFRDPELITKRLGILLPGVEPEEYPAIFTADTFQQRDVSSFEPRGNFRGGSSYRGERGSRSRGSYYRGHSRGRGSHPRGPSTRGRGSYSRGSSRDQQKREPTEPTSQPQPKRTKFE